MRERELKLRDNFGATLDRYMFIIVEQQMSYFYSFSADPDSPMGVNHYCGSSLDGLVDGPHLGEVIHFMDIPTKVRDAIFVRYNENREKLIADIKKSILKFEARSKDEITKKELNDYRSLIEALNEILAA